MLGRLRTLTFPVRFNYICHKELEKIKTSYGSEKKQQVKMWVHYMRHRTTVGMKHMKSDLSAYYSYLRKIQNPTPQQRRELFRIENDMRKLLPVAIIQALPASPVLFVAYLKFFPDALPSWFDVDKDYNQRQQHYMIKRIEAVNEAKNFEHYNIDEHNVQKLKTIALALAGRTVDGTNVLNKVIKTPIDAAQWPLKLLSAYLLRRQIVKQLKSDPDLHHLAASPIHQKIEYKLRPMMELSQQPDQHEK